MVVLNLLKYFVKQMQIHTFTYMLECHRSRGGPVLGQEEI
jgi:hypothetical protein